MPEFGSQGSPQDGLLVQVCGQAYPGKSFLNSNCRSQPWAPAAPREFLAFQGPLCVAGGRKESSVFKVIPAEMDVADENGAPPVGAANSSQWVS